MSNFGRQDDRCNYLTSYSPKDKPWDTHRAQADVVAGLYGATVYDKFKARMDSCSGYLGFRWLDESETGESRLKLFQSHFCRCRHCPICQWRRSLMWAARFYQALPTIQAQYPTARWLFLTLTVRNCSLSELRDTLRFMNTAWNRLMLLKDWPALGYVRSTEVTRGKDGSAHPHFHVLLMVQPSYFSGKYYLTQARWTEMWQKSARLSYTPLVDVRAVRGNDVSNILPEVLKYAVKPEDMMQSASWLEVLTTQLRNLRFLATGGCLKNILHEGEETNEDLIKLGDEFDEETAHKILKFAWDRSVKHYRKIKK